MAEATGNPSTNDEIWFNEAVTQLAKRSGESADYAEQLLIKGLEDGLVPWSHMEDGIRVKGGAVFWQRRKRYVLETDREKNLARLLNIIPEANPPDGPGTVKDIKVAHRAALALLPAEPAAEPAANPAQPEPEVATEAADTAAVEAVDDTTVVAAKKKKGKARLRIAEAAKKLWPPDGIAPLDVTPADLEHAIEALDKREAEARSAASGKKEKPPAPPSWSSCKRFLEDQRGP